jgi:hypothetical protein
VSLEALLDIQPDQLDDDQLTQYNLELIQLADRLKAKTLAALGEWDNRAIWAADGAVNAGTWLARNAELSGQEARTLIRGARSLRRTTAVAAAVANGDLSTNKGLILARLANPRTAQHFQQAEQLLVKQAQDLSVDDTKTLARQWQIMADSDGPEPDHGDQSARLSPSYDGWWRLDANLNPDDGLIFRTALDQIMQDLYQAETADGRPARTAAQRRADALAEMARRATAAPHDKPAARPLIIIKADLDDLKRRAGSTATTDDGYPITPDMLHRLLCDANISRVIIDSDSAVIDVGRESRTATAAQRRALTVRDRGCVFPGCDRPPGWCEAHHIQWWEHNGPTNLQNLALLCSRHHHDIHKGLFNISRHPDGQITFTRANGHPLN